MLLGNERFFPFLYQLGVGERERLDEREEWL